MVSWPLEVDALDAHSCDTETLWSVTWRLWVLTQRPGKTSQLIGHNGEEPWPSTSKQEKRSWHKPPQRDGPAESFVSALSNRQHTHATLAKSTAIHVSAFTVIVADAPAKHTTRMLYPWSTVTDGGLLHITLTAVVYCIKNVGPNVSIAGFQFFTVGRVSVLFIRLNCAPFKAQAQFFNVNSEPIVSKLPNYACK